MIRVVWAFIFFNLLTSKATENEDELGCSSSMQLSYFIFKGDFAVESTVMKMFLKI
jgi:hypothetical protein